MMRRMVGIVVVLAALMAVMRRAVAQPDGNGLQTIHAKVGEIPILVVAPAETKGRMLIIWLTGFSGSKEKVEAHLREFAKHGFVGLSFDPYQHGERRIEPNEALSKRVVGNNPNGGGLITKSFGEPILRERGDAYGLDCKMKN